MKWKKKHVELILEMQRNGWKLEHIGNYFSIKGTTVSQIIAKYKRGGFRKEHTKVGNGKRYQT